MDLGECHLCLNVADMAAALDFYVKLHFDLREDHVDEGWAILSHNNLVLGLYQGHIDSMVINFRGGDVAALAADAAAKGLPFKKKVQEHPNGSWSAELLDPDGNVIFLNTYPDERARYLQEGTVIP